MDPDRTTLSPTDTTRPGAPIVTPGVEEEEADGTVTPTNTEAEISFETPPHLRDAIADIEQYQFTPPSQQEAEDETIAAFMMFGPGTVGSTELPTLETEPWPHKGLKTPNPISIGTAVKLLAAAYAQIPCELEDAGLHGYAWIIEQDPVWLKRDGVSAAISPPTKPKTESSYDMKVRWEYADKLQKYTLYNHLVHAGKAKLLEWFGKPLFVDLFVNGMLPTARTPKELITHLEATYANTRDYRRFIDEVEKELNAPLNPKEPVEAYFMRLQEAKTHADLLKQAFSETYIMNRALKQFDVHYGKSAYKAEKRWNEKPDADRTWSNFKTYWKNEVHQWDTMAGGDKKQANHAVDLTGLVNDVTALQAEARSMRSVNDELSRQVEFQSALLADRADRASKGDDVSTITDYLEGFERRLKSSLPGTTTTDSQLTPTDESRRQELIKIARERNPADYKNLRGGRGKRFSSYCFHCGCNCTHWTRRCFELSSADRKKYANADFDNTMGGSTKFLERRGKDQADFGFDSL